MLDKVACSLVLLLFGINCLFSEHVFCQEPVEEAESLMYDYVHDSRLKIDDKWMLTVNAQFSTDPESKCPHETQENFVRLVSKDDDFIWERSFRKSSLLNPQQAETYRHAKDDSWSLLKVGSKSFGVNTNLSYSSESLGINLGNLLKLAKNGGTEIGKLPFPEFDEWPFLTWDGRLQKRPDGFVRLLFLENLDCVSASKVGGLLTSYWLYKHRDSAYAWELIFENDLPTIVRLLKFKEKIRKDMPERSKGTVLSDIHTTWQKNEYGRFPKTLRASYFVTGDFEEFSGLEATFHLDVKNDAYENELARVREAFKIVTAETDGKF